MKKIGKWIGKWIEEVQKAEIPTSAFDSEVKQVYVNLLRATQIVAEDPEISELTKRAVTTFGKSLLLPLKEYIEITPDFTEFDENRKLITADEKILEMHYRAAKSGRDTEMLSETSLKGLGNISITTTTAMQGKFKLSLKVEPKELSGTASLRTTIKQGLVDAGLDEEEIEDILSWKQDVVKEIETNNWIAGIPFGSGKTTLTLAQNFMEEIARHGQKVFENFEIESVKNGAEARIVDPTGKTFSLTYKEDGFHLVESEGTQITDIEQFKQEIQEKLDVFNRLLNFMYQEASIEIPETFVEIELPGRKILAKLIETDGIVELFKGFPYRLNDLAFQGEQRKYLRVLAREVAKYLKGEIKQKPSFVLIYGESGVGKSIIAKATMEELKGQEIPCYIIRPYSGEDSYLQGLREFFFWAKLNNVFVYIEDFEKILGEDYMDYTRKHEIETLFNYGVEELAASGSYVLATTEEPERIFSQSLLQGHRFGERIPLEKVKEPEEIEAMILMNLRMIDAGLNQAPQSSVSVEEIKRKYKMDYREVSKYIASKGGLVAAQIKRILLKSLKGNTVNTDILKAEVDAYIVQEKELQKRREPARTRELEKMLFSLQEKVEQLSQGKVLENKGAIEKTEQRVESIPEKTAEIKKIAELQKRLQQRLEMLEDKTRQIEDRQVTTKEEITEIREKAREPSITALQARYIALKEIQRMAERVLEFIDGKKD